MQPNPDLLPLIRQTIEQERKQLLLNLLARLQITSIEEEVFQALVTEMKGYEEDFFKLQQALEHEELLQRTFYKPL